MTGEAVDLCGPGAAEEGDKFGAGAEGRAGGELAGCDFGDAGIDAAGLAVEPVALVASAGAFGSRGEVMACEFTTVGSGAAPLCSNFGASGRGRAGSRGPDGATEDRTCAMGGVGSCVEGKEEATGAAIAAGCLGSGWGSGEIGGAGRGSTMRSSAGAAGMTGIVLADIGKMAGSG